jgi:hypothetical protein
MQRKTSFILIIVAWIFITNCASEQPSVLKFNGFKSEIESQLMDCAKYLEKGAKNNTVYVLLLMNNPGFLEVTVFPIEYYSEICIWEPDFYIQIEGKYFMICSGLIDLSNSANYDQYFTEFRKILGKNLISDIEKNNDCRGIEPAIIDRKAIKLIINDKVIIKDTIDVWGPAPIAADSTSFFEN